jgi:hypothetical protein
VLYSGAVRGTVGGVFCAVGQCVVQWEECFVHTTVALVREQMQVGTSLDQQKKLVHIRLESGRHLLQMSTREEFSQAEIVPVRVLMEISLSRPAP